MSTTTTAAPVRATWKGMGNPAEIIYFGHGKAPATGTRATVKAEDGLLQFTGKGGKGLARLGTATKFWAVPVEASAAKPAARKAPAKKVNGVAKKAPVKAAAQAVNRADKAKAPAVMLPAGYAIKYLNGAYNLAKKGEDAAENAAAWIVICTAHGTTTTAGKAKEGDELGRKAGRLTWCEKCQAAAGTEAPVKPVAKKPVAKKAPARTAKK